MQKIIVNKVFLRIQLIFLNLKGLYKTLLNSISFGTLTDGRTDDEWKEGQVFNNFFIMISILVKKKIFEINVQLVKNKCF